jgi:hypothetical protein
VFLDTNGELTSGMGVAVVLCIMDTTLKTLAQFDDVTAAKRCLETLRRRQFFRPEVKVDVQYTKKGHEELPVSFTHAKGGFIRGALMGGVVGFIAGMVIALLESQLRGITPIFAGAFAVFGMMMGAFAGVLVGPMNPDPNLEKMEEDGAVVLLVQSPNQKDIAWASRQMGKFGGKLMMQDRRAVNPPVQVRDREASHA